MSLYNLIQTAASVTAHGQDISGGRDEKTGYKEEGPEVWMKISLVHLPIALRVLPIQSLCHSNICCTCDQGPRRGQGDRLALQAG